MEFRAFFLDEETRTLVADRIKADVLTSNFNRIPNDGEIWYSLPTECLVTLSNDTMDDETKCPGAFNGSRVWRPSHHEPPGFEAAKLYYKGCRRPSRLCPRPGVLLCKGDIDIAEFGRGIFVPSRRKQLPLRSPGPELVIKYAKNVGTPPYSSFQFWGAWGINLGMDLLAPRKDNIKDHKLERVGNNRSLEPNDDALEYSHRLLAEVLGLKELTWKPSLKKRTKRPRRGEIVQLQTSTQKVIPSIVVSPDEINQHPMDQLIVLRCNEYQEGDKQKPWQISIGEDGVLKNIDGRWSASPLLIRGIGGRASHFIKRFSPPIFMPQKVMIEIDEWLDFFYA